MKKSFKKAGAAVLSMAMLLSMGAISMPVYAAPTSGSNSTGKPATVTVQISGLTTDAYHQGEGQMIEPHNNGDGPDSEVNVSNYPGKYDYWKMETGEGIEDGKVTMFRIAQLTPDAGWQWADFIQSALDSNNTIPNFTDFAELMKNKDTDLKEGDDGYEDIASSYTGKPEFNTSNETLKQMASYFERLAVDYKATTEAAIATLQADYDAKKAAADAAPTDTAKATAAENAKKALDAKKAEYNKVLVATREFTNDDIKNNSTVVIPTTDADALDINGDGVLDDNEMAGTQNVIGYYLIVTETNQSGAILQPVLVCLKNGQNKNISVKGSKIEFEKKMTAIESGTETTSTTTGEGEGATTTTTPKNKEADRFDATKKTGLVAQKDTVHYQIVAQLPKYDPNVKPGDITDFVITDTASEGISIYAPQKSGTTEVLKEVDPDEFEVFLVEKKEDAGNEGAKRWVLTGSELRNVGDYQLEVDEDTHGFKLTISGYQLRELDLYTNVSGQGVGAVSRTDPTPDGVVDDVSLLTVDNSTEAPSGADSMALATRTKDANGLTNKADMENMYIYVNFKAKVNADNSGVERTDETKDADHGGLAFDRSFTEYATVGDVKAEWLTDDFLGETDVTDVAATSDIDEEAVAKSKDVTKQILRVQLANGETRYNKKYTTSDYSVSTMTTQLGDKADAVKTALTSAGFDGTKLLGDSAEGEALRIRVLLARDKHNIELNGEYNTAHMTYGNRYATGKGQAQLNTDYSKVYSVDLELNKFIEVYNLEGVPAIEMDKTSLGKFAQNNMGTSVTYSYTPEGGGAEPVSATFTLNDIKIYKDKEFAQAGIPISDYNKTDVEIKAAMNTADGLDTALAAQITRVTGLSDTDDTIIPIEGSPENKSNQKAYALYLLDQKNDATKATDAYKAANAISKDPNSVDTVGDGGTDLDDKVDRITGEEITGKKVKDQAAEDYWDSLDPAQQKVVMSEAEKANADRPESKYNRVDGKQAVTGAIFHLVRTDGGEGDAAKVVEDMGYAVSTNTGELQKLTVASTLYDTQAEATAAKNTYATAHANEECYVFQDETGKWRYGHIAVTRDGDKITAFNGDKTWREIDIGDYRIYELYVPTGFKKWNYAEFEISANKETGTGTFAALQNGAFTGKFDATTDIKKDTSATSSSGFGSIEQQKNVTVDEGERVGKLHFTYVYDEENQKYTGVLTEDLYNEYLDQLPATGGMGTVLFTAGGIAVILMAGALFVVYMKKRNAEEEE